jgi:hypothetical protein
MFPKGEEKDKDKDKERKASPLLNTPSGISLIGS